MYFSGQVSKSRLNLNHDIYIDVPTCPSLLQEVMSRSPGRNFDWNTFCLWPELNCSIFLEVRARGGQGCRP